mgnify:CR=1 FL=1
MKLAKEIAIFFIIIVLIITGAIFFMKKNFSNGPKPIEIKEKQITKEAQKDKKEQEFLSKKHDTMEGVIIETSNLDTVIHLKCKKGQYIAEIIKDIGEKYSVKFKMNTDEIEEKIDISMDIKGVTIKEMLEILLGNQAYFWYDKGTEIIIMRKR